MYYIMGYYRGQKEEEIDSFETNEEAEKMLLEYQIAYGSDFTLWIEYRD